MIEIPTFDLTNALPWKGLVIHHSATADGKDNDWAGIKKFHTSYRKAGEIITEAEAQKLIFEGKKNQVTSPWSDIGYHFGLERDGGVLKAILGRKLSIVGGHAVGFNHTHLGLCIVGNFDKAEPDAELWEAAVKYARYIIYAFKFSRTAILGHRETFPLRGVPVEKSCPGKLFDLNAFREAV